jgi:uncharacterized protein with HEPN domain
MPGRDWTLRVRDILEAIAAIRKYTAGMTFQNFAEDRKTVDAVIRNFIIIGEAANHVPEDIMEKYSDIAWRDMRDMRNIVVHEYFGVNDAILWETLMRNLPPLVSLLQGVLEQESKEPMPAH